MEARDFIYWLRGFLEICDPKTINEKQTKVIKEHLEKCFTEVIPVSEIPNITKDEPPEYIRKFMEKPQVYCGTLFNPNIPIDGSC